jgi:signal transduction histidine kinase
LIDMTVTHTDTRLSRSTFRGMIAFASATLLLCRLWTAAPAQNIDSLTATFADLPADSTKVIALNTAARTLARENPVAADVLAGKALSLSRGLGWLPGIAEARNTRGAIMVNQGAYEEAIGMFQANLRTLDTLADSTGMARAMRNIGIIHRRIGNLDEALLFTRRSMELSRRIGDSLSFAKALVMLGNIENQRGNYDVALSAFRRAEPIFIRTGDDFGESSVLNGMGISYDNLGDSDMALSLYRRSLEVNRRQGNLREMAGIHINISEIYRGRGDAALAARETGKAMELAGKAGALDLVSTTSRDLAGFYQSRGQYRKAYDYYVRYATLRDSLLNEKMLRSIHELSQRFESEKREQHISLLEKDRQLKEEQLRNASYIRNIVIAGLFLSLLVAVGMFRLARGRKHSNERLSRALSELQRTQGQLVHAEKMAAYGRLATGVAHELQNPMNFILNFSELSSSFLRENAEALSEGRIPLADIEALEQNIIRIGNYGARASSIVSGMLQHGRGAGGQPEETDLHGLLTRCWELAYSSVLAAHPDAGVACVREYDPSITTVPVQPRDITQAFVHVFQNALDAVLRRDDAVGEGYAPEVRVRTAMREGQVEIRIRDNGTGIPDAILPRIFEPFFTTKEPGRGTGLGLSMCYDIVSGGHGGSITVESREGVGSEFVILLPKTHG